MKPQPGAQLGDRTFCPVSGVAFTVKDDSPHREVDGKQIYFCCGACAGYFDQHVEHVAQVRGFVANR